MPADESTARSTPTAGTTSDQNSCSDQHPAANAAASGVADYSTMEGHLAIMAIMNLARKNGWAHPEWVSSRVEAVAQPSVGGNGIGDGVQGLLWQCEVCLADCSPPCNQSVLGHIASSKKVAKQQAAIAWMGVYAKQQAREQMLEEGEVQENIPQPTAATVQQDGPTTLATDGGTSVKTAGVPVAVAAEELIAPSVKTVVPAEEDDGCLSDE